MSRIILHVDMDAFYAAVEVRDNPELQGKPLIIGALPTERGVVSTCSYEARKFGVRSAMSIKEAYRLCPHGIYMHPNPRKYREASDRIHEIWSTYTDLVEYISLDEGFLDVTGSAHLFGGADSIGLEIKERTKREIGLTCSVGIGYSMMSAKLASEEKKPDGFFAIPTPEFLVNLISGRSVRTIYGVGEKTAAELQRKGINTVRDIRENRQTVEHLLGNHGKDILNLADGIDDRRVTPYAEAKSIGKEHTFQQDITDFDYLKDCLLLIARDLSFDVHCRGLFSRTITLKVKYANMQSITRSKSGDATNKADVIYKTAAEMLDAVNKRPIRLVGITLNNLTDSAAAQLDFESMLEEPQKSDKLHDAVFDLQKRYGKGVFKTANELNAEKRFEK